MMERQLLPVQMMRTFGMGSLFAYERVHYYSDEDILDFAL
jgi:hypothetical protein